MRRWMIVADDSPGVTWDLGWHYWTRRAAQAEADSRNGRLTANYGGYSSVHWYVARVGDFPAWADR